MNIDASLVKKGIDNWFDHDEKARRRFFVALKRTTGQQNTQAATNMINEFFSTEIYDWCSGVDAIAIAFTPTSDFRIFYKPVPIGIFPE